MLNTKPYTSNPRVQIKELGSLCGAEGRREEDRAKEGTKLNMERQRVLDDLRVRFH